MTRYTNQSVFFVIYFMEENGEGTGCQNGRRDRFFTLKNREAVDSLRHFLHFVLPVSLLSVLFVGSRELTLT